MDLILPTPKEGRSFSVNSKSDPAAIRCILLFSSKYAKLQNKDLKIYVYYNIRHLINIEY